MYTSTLAHSHKQTSKHSHTHTITGTQRYRQRQWKWQTQTHRNKLTRKQTHRNTNRFTGTGHTTHTNAHTMELPIKKCVCVLFHSKLEKSYSRTKTKWIHKPLHDPCIIMILRFWKTSEYIFELIKGWGFSSRASFEADVVPISLWPMMDKNYPRVLVCLRFWSKL